MERTSNITSTAHEAHKDDEEEQQTGTPPNIAEAVVEKEGGKETDITSMAEEAHKDDGEKQNTSTASITAEQQDNTKAEADANNMISTAEEAQKDDEEKPHTGTSSITLEHPNNTASNTVAAEDGGKEAQKDDGEKQNTSTASITAEQQDNTKAEADANNMISTAEEAQKDDEEKQHTASNTAETTDAAMQHDDVAYDVNENDFMVVRCSMDVLDSIYNTTSWLFSWQPKLSKSGSDAKLCFVESGSCLVIGTAHLESVQVIKGFPALRISAPFAKSSEMQRKGWRKRILLSRCLFNFYFL